MPLKTIQVTTKYNKNVMVQKWVYAPKVDRVCIKCGIKFLGSKLKLYCKSCSKIPKSKNTVCCGTQGAISELLVATSILNLNIPVFRALSPSCPSDLVILINEELISIEVRTGRILRTGGIWCPTANMHSDIYAIYLKEEKKIVYKAYTEKGRTFLATNHNFES